jgi:hypothetical protein
VIARHGSFRALAGKIAALPHSEIFRRACVPLAADCPQQK